MNATNCDNCLVITEVILILFFHQGAVTWEISHGHQKVSTIRAHTRPFQTCLHLRLTHPLVTAGIALTLLIAGQLRTSAPTSMAQTSVAVCLHLSKHLLVSWMALLVGLLMLNPPSRLLHWQATQVKFCHVRLVTLIISHPFLPVGICAK